MKTKSRLTFARLPGDYAGLCRVHLPRKTRDRVDYENTMEIVEVMAPQAGHFTPDQEDYFDLLSHLVADYDTAEVKWPKVGTSGLLEHLMAERGMTAADLSRVLGASRNLGGMILRGERRLTLDHVTRLAKHFDVSPVLFLED
jgi:HTH-type transcriptional regulator / antitoxin HigA